MNSTDPEFPLISAECFLENMGGDAALCVTIIETGLKEGDEQMARIQNLTGESNGQAALRVLHSLRGGSATFEAVSLVAILQKMETECEVSGVKSILPHLKAFEAEAIAYRKGLLRLMEELRGRL